MNADQRTALRAQLNELISDNLDGEGTRRGAPEINWSDLLQLLWEGALIGADVQRAIIAADVRELATLDHGPIKHSTVLGYLADDLTDCAERCACGYPYNAHPAPDERCPADGGRRSTYVAASEVKS